MKTNQMRVLSYVRYGIIKGISVVLLSMRHYCDECREDEWWKKAGLILVDGCLDEVMLDWQGMSHTGSIGEKLHPVAATFQCVDALHCCTFSVCMCSEVKVSIDGI